MGDLSRIGVAIDANLLKKFGHLISSRDYTRRSEAFRDLIRDELVEKMSAMHVHPDLDSFTSTSKGAEL
jgi:metal-responsive CopG/Arc/MetJ family transcriptional regulator